MTLKHTTSNSRTCGSKSFLVGRTPLKASDAQKATALDGLKTEFISLKNQIAGDPDDNKKAPAALSAADFAKLSPSEKIRLKAMNKAGI